MSQNNENLSLSGVNNPVLVHLYDTIPHSGVSHCFGREKKLETLRQLLQENNQVAIAGIGGVGKTELAIQYAKANLNQYAGGICWLFARSDLGLQIVEFARSHFPNFTIPPKLTPATQVAYCWQHWIPTQGEVLVIIDNVTNYSQIQAYLPPPSSRFKILMTTRLQLEQPVQMLSLEVLTPSAALELLASPIGKYRVKDTRGKPFGIDPKRKHGKQKQKQAASFSIKEKEQGVGEQLCELLDYLPLGIELVGRYLEQEQNLSLETMRSRLQKQYTSCSSLIQQKDNLTQDLTTQISLAAALELSWKRLDEEAQNLAGLLSVFALAPIPWAQVESVYGQLYLPGTLLGKLLNISSTDSQTDIESLIETLQRNLKEIRHQLLQLHLLQCTGEETYQLHPIIRELLLAKLNKLEQSLDIKKAFCQVMVAVTKQIPDSPTRDLIEEVAPAIPHIAEATTTLREFISNEDLVESLEGLGWFYQSQGFYDQAAPYWEQCLSISQVCFGSDHPNIASKLHNLAWIYYAQERYTEAKSLSIQALKIYEQHLGLEHPLTVATRKNLEALNYQKLLDLEQNFH